MTTIRPLVWFCFGYAFGNVLPSDGYLVNVYKVKAQPDKDYIILYIMLLLYFRRIVKKYFYLLIYFVSKVLDLMHLVEIHFYKQILYYLKYLSDFQATSYITVPFRILMYGNYK